MKFVLAGLLFMLLGMPCRCQTTGTANTKGPCSPAVTGNDNTFTISCPGISASQGREMLGILNKILANQLDPNLVMTKLNEILSAVGPAIDEKTLQALAQYAYGGNIIQNTFARGGDTGRLTKEYSQWVISVETFLTKNVRPSASLQFKNVHGNAFMGCPPNTPADGCGIWQDIQGKKDFLDSLK